MQEVIAELRVPARADRLGMVRDIIKRSADAAGCDKKLGDSLVIAVNEACMNIIQHAYNNTGAGDIAMHVSLIDGQLRIRLVDSAAPVNLDNVKSRDLEDIRPGGLGVHFIREIMDRVDMGHLEQGTGNYLEMVKNIT